MFKQILSAGAALLLAAPAIAQAPAPRITVPASCANGGLSAADYKLFKAALAAAVKVQPANGGLAFNMWASLVANDGTVCAVAFSGEKFTDQWLASRVISAQKAFTANSLSLGKVDGASDKGALALSTANLYSAVQPGGSLYGLQHSNPVAPAGAYGDTIAGGAYQGPAVPPAAVYGTQNDPMVRQIIGGINVFGGGLALYAATGKVGGVGVSGDTSCTDHMVAWRIRHILNLDLLKTAGIAGPASLFAGDPNHPDNIIFDITPNPSGGTGISKSGFGHATCLNTPNPKALPPVQ
ncbi:MAG TPA: hypothetical protein VFG05_12445 [Methylocella sp.]|nr:hypothetical protein [Methylocella sp.]